VAQHGLPDLGPRRRRGAVLGVPTGLLGGRAGTRPTAVWPSRAPCGAIRRTTERTDSSRGRHELPVTCHNAGTGDVYCTATG
jgi:hypothetical protein